MNRLWLNLEAIQQPTYLSQDVLNSALSRLSEAPSLITFSEICLLKSLLSSASEGKSFILQIGDCAEPFSDTKDSILPEKLSKLNDFKNSLQESLGISVTLIGRIAGQYTKPRSEPFEIINDTKVQSYKGDLVNSIDPNLRDPDPNRLIEGYNHAAIITNFIRHSSKDFFTSHEALHILYEDSLTRKLPEGLINAGAHFLWLGERTRKLGSAHVEYLANISNPIGIKVGPNANLEELVMILKKINPGNETGRITLICRLGAKNYATQLGGIIERVNSEGLKVGWMIDPMHGNTYKAVNGLKTRRFDDIAEECIGGIRIFKEHRTQLAGIHLEACYKEVTEVVDAEITEEKLVESYESLCDPRLNSTQTLSLLNIISHSLLNTS